METPKEFVERFLSTPCGIAGHELLARMVAARDAEALSHIADERQKRIDERATAIYAADPGTYTAKWDEAYRAAVEGEGVRARLIEEERRLARKDAPTA